MAGVQLRDGVSGNRRCRSGPPFVTTEDEVALIAQTIAQVLDTYPA